MARIALFYGTTEGRTGIIAERMAAVLGEAGHDPVLFHAGHLPTGFSLAGAVAVEGAGGWITVRTTIQSAEETVTVTRPTGRLTWLLAALTMGVATDFASRGGFTTR